MHQLAKIGISLRRSTQAQPCAFGFMLKQTRPAGSKFIQEDGPQIAQFAGVDAANATLRLSHVRRHLNSPYASNEKSLMSLSTVGSFQQQRRN